jgi:hypothetical protein
VQGEQAPLVGCPPRSRVRCSSRRETGGLDGWSSLDKIRLTGLLRKKPRKRGFFYARRFVGNSSGFPPAGQAGGRKKQAIDDRS